MIIEEASDLQLGERKQANIQNCFYQIHSCGLIPYKGQRPGQLYKFWFQREQINGSDRTSVYLNSSALKHPEKAMPHWAKILAEKYINEYYFLQKVVKDSVGDISFVREEKVGCVQNYIDLNPECFMAARNLLLHLRMDIQALLTSEITFKESNESIKNIYQKTIWELLGELSQRLHHVRKETQRKGCHQMVKQYALKYSDLHTHEFFEDVFTWITQIKKYIAEIRQQISKMLKRQLDENRLIQICEFIAKLQGPKDRNSRFLLSQLWHFKTVYHKFQPTSEYREELQDFIRERMQQIRYIAFTKMGFSLRECDQQSKQIYLNTYGHLQTQLEELFNQWFYAILRWNLNGELEQFRKPHNTKQNCSIILLKVQHGKGENREIGNPAILSLLQQFKTKNLAWVKKNWKLKLYSWILNQKPKNVFYIRMLLEEEPPAS